MGVFEDVVMGAPVRRHRGRERRVHRRLPQLRAARSGLSANLWELDLLPAVALDRLTGDIAALSKRAMEPNIFFDATVVAAAWPRLTSLLAPQGCWMACLWETIGDRRHLRLFMPMRLARVGLPRQTVLQPLSNDFMPVGVPLLDVAIPGETCEMLLQLLAAPELRLPPLLDLTHMRADGPAARHLHEAVKTMGLPTAITRAHERAALTARKDGSDPVREALGAKGLRELSRQMRRLEESGPVTFRCASEPEPVLDAFETFVALELAGWKGRRASALYNHKRVAAFSRQISVLLAEERACEIVEMRHDSGSGPRTVASLILFGRKGSVVPWKMAFDERLSKFSPGSQLMAHTTQLLIARKSFKSADSLAIADHWMMNRLWPDRIAIHDRAVALTTRDGQKLTAYIAAKQRRDRWHATARRLAKALKLR